MAKTTKKRVTKKKTAQKPQMSMLGWNLWEFLRGRRKMAITVVAAVLGYFLSDSTLIAGVSGGVVEAVWAIAEYFYKQRTLN